MAKSKKTKPTKKNNHALRNFLGAVALAGATYAAEKMIESKKKKKSTEKKQN